MSTLYMIVFLGANFYQGAPKITILSKVTHCTLSMTISGFTANTKTMIMLSLEIVILQIKKRQSNTKSNSLDFTGYKTILGKE